MPAFIDRTGQRYARLIALEIHDRQNSHVRWLCRCDCGKFTVVKGIHLANGNQQSCGCLMREQCIARSTTHGLSRVGGKWTPEYRTWRNMKNRCHNPKDPAYLKYGAKGIHVCPEWREDYPAFFAYIGPKPSPKHSVDRVDNNLGYQPGNVRWALADVQRLNQHKAGLFLDLDDNPIRIKDVAHHLAMNRQTFMKLMQRSGRV